MDIQNPWKSPVESCDAVFENLKEEQKNNHNSANREVFHRNPTESTVPKPTMSKRFCGSFGRGEETESLDR